MAPGVYNLTVDGTGTAGNRSTPLTLTVTAAAADYALSLNPAAFTIAPGANGNTTVTLTRTNFTGAVTLSLGGAPAGVTGSFNPGGPHGDQLHPHGDRRGRGGSRGLQPDRGWHRHGW